MSVIKKVFLVILLGLNLMGSAVSVQASMLPESWYKPIDDIDVPKPDSDQNGIELIQELVLGNFAQIARYLFISVSILYIFVQILIIVLNSSDEGKTDEAKTAIKNVILGLIIVSLSSELAKVFDIATLDGEIGDTDQAKKIFQIIINYLSLLAGSVAVLYILFSASKLIMSGGDDGAKDETKKNITNALVGLLVIIMSDTMINKVFYPIEDGAPVAPTDSHQATFAEELFGFIAYVLEFLAIGSILLMILAGLFYITSVGNTDNTDKAKTILKNLVMGFITITIAYTIVSAFVPGTDGIITPK